MTLRKEGTELTVNLRKIHLVAMFGLSEVGKELEPNTIFEGKGGELSCKTQDNLVDILLWTHH
jgi:hypothetical protein